jgi:hypothetical protein
MLYAALRCATLRYAALRCATYRAGARVRRLPAGEGDEQRDAERVVVGALRVLQRLDECGSM